MKNTEKTMEKIVALCKNRGFVFPGSEIYGGLANTWDLKSAAFSAPRGLAPSVPSLKRSVKKRLLSRCLYCAQHTMHDQGL